MIKCIFFYLFLINQFFSVIFVHPGTKNLIKNGSLEYPFLKIENAFLISKNLDVIFLLKGNLTQINIFEKIEIINKKIYLNSNFSINLGLYSNLSFFLTNSTLSIQKQITFLNKNEIINYLFKLENSKLILQV